MYKIFIVKENFANGQQNLDKDRSKFIIFLIALKKPC